MQKRHLRIPGEKELAGRGVVYCSTCDGPLFKGLDIAVVGGGNSALEAALEMDGVARQVYLVARSGLAGDQVLEDKVATAAGVECWRTTSPWRSTAATRSRASRCSTARRAPRRSSPSQGVFVEIGLFPNTAFALDLVDTNERGEIIVDSHCRTGVRGVFAAGDCTDTHDKQIVISVGRRREGRAGGLRVPRRAGLRRAGAPAFCA